MVVSIATWNKQYADATKYAGGSAHKTSKRNLRLLKLE